MQAKANAIQLAQLNNKKAGDVIRIIEETSTKDTFTNFIDNYMKILGPAFNSIFKGGLNFNANDKITLTRSVRVR